MRNMRIQMSGSPEDFDMAELLLFRILVRNVIILTWHGGLPVLDAGELSLSCIILVIEHIYSLENTWDRQQKQNTCNSGGIQSNQDSIYLEVNLCGDLVPLEQGEDPQSFRTDHNSDTHGQIVASGYREYSLF